MAVRLIKSFVPFQPSENWPFWTFLVAGFSTPADRGIGDTIRREVGGPKTERFKRWHEATFGVWSAPCGCGKMAEWNAIYPYEKKPPVS